jgi:cytochrome c553
MHWLRAAALVPLLLIGHAAAQASEGAEVAARQYVSCHGSSGISPTPGVPHLAGQLSRYLLNQLRHCAAGRRSDPTMEAASAVR